MKVAIINGPNLNFLGLRQPDVYGSETLETINQEIQSFSEEEGYDVSFFQSNSEGELIDHIQKVYLEKVEGIVMNPAAYTHYSYALHDALSGIDIPAVEVHLSAVHQREEFRKKSVTAPACIGQISGFGSMGYILGLMALDKYISRGNL